MLSSVRQSCEQTSIGIGSPRCPIGAQDVWKKQNELRSLVTGNLEDMCLIAPKSREWKTSQAAPGEEGTSW